MTVGWFMDDEPSPSFPIYTRGNVGEVFPDPVSPLTADHTWHGAGDVGMRDFMSRFTIDLEEIDDGHKVMFEIFGGYMYLNLSIARLMGARSSGMTPELVDMGFFGSQSSLPAYVPRPNDDDPEIVARVDGLMFSWMTATEFPRLDEHVAEVEALVAARPDLGNASEAGLVARMREMMPVFARVFATHGEVSAAASVTMGAITAMALGLRRPGLDLRIAGGLGGVASVAPSFAMWDLSRLVAGSAELTSAFDAGLDGLPERLTGLDGPATEFLTGLDALLAEHGSRGPNEWELRSPAWGIHPELVLTLIDRMRLSDDDADPRARHEAAGAQAAEALRVLRDMVAGDEAQAGTLEIANTASSVFIPARELAKATIVKVIHEARLAALEFGNRLAADGRLVEARHVFMLRDAELESAMAGDMADGATDREATYLSLFDLSPPYWFAGEVPEADAWQGDEAPIPTRRIVQGMGGSAGTATGRARVVTDPSDPSGLEPGDILIAPITDPSWTPLFVPAAGVVVDVGGTMSHAVIVCRELGIPCVVSATGATTRIPDGAQVRVNGDTGTVTILGD
ncbi:MAG: phosphoenolpyruvate-utilizing protein [Acidimicrobiaceae bacterium]|nr:phosphoenolpyruvate-utilizing protein [Acidimicrobiaceae bacterium]